MHILLEQEARETVDKVSIELGKGTICQVKFVKGRCDICALLRLAEEKNGWNAIFLVWKNDSGISYKQVIKGHFLKSELLIEEADEKRGWILVKISGFGEYSIDLIRLKLQPQRQAAVQYS